MQRIVIDANVWVSAIMFPDSVPGQVIALVHDGRMLSITSEALIGQVRRTLLRLGFAAAAISDADLELRQVSDIVAPSLQLSVIAAKESDNRVLECAVAGRADAIVTGDRKHLLSLGSYEGIPLLSPRAFLDRLDP